MRREQDNQVVMIDFGAVKELSVVSQDNQGKTTITIAVGTPVYMAPEQANGLPKLCSDIYAIGIIAIQAITGLNPQEIRKNQDTGEVIGWENFQISQKLANVLKKMVRYDYKERYKNATEAWQALVDISLKQPKFPVMEGSLGLLGSLIDRRLLGRYRITQFLGKGGFGETYLAIDMALPGHPQCVVKRLKKNPNPEVLHITRRLFETEAKTLYKLGAHNNIPQLLAHFEEDGEFYLVQEFIKGHDLTEEIIPGQPLDETSVIQLLKEILEILKYVHKNNIIHRDIKPSNLMRRGQDNQVVMIDFGAVKELSVLSSLDDEGNRTTTIPVGTPVYMAPEQNNGHPQLCSDIYAIGMIAIQAITGLDPGEIRRNQDTAGEVIGWENFQISQKLANVLKKMVRYNYKERYKNATEALEALVDISPKPRKFIVKVMISSVITAIAGISFLLIWRYLKPDLIGNYNQLEKYLKTQDWQKANQETIDIMLKVTKRDSEGYLNANAINNFPCKDLVHLNQLWQDYSQEKFGFSAQKSKYEETGNTIGKYNEKNFNKFGNNVGWQQQGIWISDLELDFSNEALPGHLPSSTILRDALRKGELFSRMNNCPPNISGLTQYFYIWCKNLSFFR
jgi:serine/threonine-protein kinase